MPRTNNQLESCHNAFQNSTEAQHPSIFKFLNSLQREESQQKFNLTQVLQGRDLVNKKKKYVALNSRLKRVQQNAERYTVKEFLGAIANNLEINVA